MEDVFLSVGHDSEDNGDEINGDHKKLKEKSSETLLINSKIQLRGSHLFKTRVIGLLAKKFNFAKRYWVLVEKNLPKE
jgi:hypothetical protein